MPDAIRWRTPPEIRAHIAAELAAARTGDDPWPSLERAHLLSQPWAWPHTRVHRAMLGAALRQRDRRGALGQVVRLGVAASGSPAGRYPEGNTGRTAMRLTETAPLPDYIDQVLRQVQVSR